MSYNKFIQACRQGELKEVQSYVARPDYINRNRVEALNVALRYGHLEIARCILSLPELNLKSNEHAAFILACNLGYDDIVKTLLTFPVINPACSQHLPLQEACFGGHVLVVKLLISRLLVETKSTVTNSYFFSRALVLAIDKSHLPVVEVLISNQTFVDRLSNPLYTYITEVIKTGNTELLSLFHRLYLSFFHTSYVLFCDTAIFHRSLVMVNYFKDFSQTEWQSYLSGLISKFEFNSGFDNNVLFLMQHNLLDSETISELITRAIQSRSTSTLKRILPILKENISPKVSIYAVAFKEKEPELLELLLNSPYIKVPTVEDFNITYDCQALQYAEVDILIEHIGKIEKIQQIIETKMSGLINNDEQLKEAVLKYNHILDLHIDMLLRLSTKQLLVKTKMDLKSIDDSVLQVTKSQAKCFVDNVTLYEKYLSSHEFNALSMVATIYAEKNVFTFNYEAAKLKADIDILRVKGPIYKGTGAARKDPHIEIRRYYERVGLKKEDNLIQSNLESNREGSQEISTLKAPTGPMVHDDDSFDSDFSTMTDKEINEAVLRAYRRMS